MWGGRGGRKDRKREIDSLVQQWSYDIDKRAPSLNILLDAFLIYSSLTEQNYTVHVHM